MSDLTDELRPEPDRLDALEKNLTARVVALENKQHDDHLDDRNRLDKLEQDLVALRQRVDGIDIDHRTDLFALLHLLALTARQVKVPELEISKAMARAKAGL